MYEFDFAILDFIYEHLHCSFLDTFFSLITRLGDGGIFWIILALVLLIFRKTRPIGFAMAFALILDVIFCNILIKPMVARIRPYDHETHQYMKELLLINTPSDYSFPSGHTAVSFAGASAIFFRKNKLWIPALVIAVLVAFSRIYLYVHYPTDILGGIILGIVVGFGGAKIAIYLEKKFPKILTNRVGS